MSFVGIQGEYDENNTVYRLAENQLLSHRTDCDASPTASCLWPDDGPDEWMKHVAI